MKKSKDKLSEKLNDYRNRRNTEFKNLVRLYADLQSKLKAIEEKSDS